MAVEYNSLLEDRLSSWFADEESKAPTTEAKQLLARLQALVLRGGKRLRPNLLGMTYQAYEGKKTNGLIDLALALELYHQFLLVHDDIIDEDYSRHGGPNIQGFYQEDYGNSEDRIPETMALLAGDLLSAFSNQAILKSEDYSDKQKLELLSLLTITSPIAIYGQQLDSLNLNSSQLPSIEKLELINKLKTANYSVLLPMQCAAALLNLSLKEREKLSDFAMNFGLLFQLVNDYSDYFDNRSVFSGYPKYRDFSSGKITYPLLLSFQLASKNDLSYLKQMLGIKPLEQNDIKKIEGVLERSGAKAKSRKFLEPYFNLTLKSLDELSITTEAKQEFTGLVEKYRV